MSEDFFHPVPLLDVYFKRQVDLDKFSDFFNSICLFLSFRTPAAMNTLNN